MRVKQRRRSEEERQYRRESWRRQLDNTYWDEIGAFVLIAIGLISFLTLLSPSSGEVGTVWANALQSAFGLGAFVISGLILVLGAILILPKIGIVIPFNWWRIIGGELFFFAALAYFHAVIRWTYGPVEAYARAAEGRGGGLTGWAIQDLLYLGVGPAAGLILIVILLISGMMMMGVQRRHTLNFLERLQARFQGWAERLAPPEAPVPVSQPARAEAAVQPPAFTPGVQSLPVPPVSKELPEDEPELALEFVEPRALSRSVSIEDRMAQMIDAGELQYRFTLKENPDRKKTRRRGDDLPPLELLEERDYVRPSEDEINFSAQVIEETISDFGMQVEVVDVKAGPTVTQYAVQPFTRDKDGKQVIQRVRVSRVAGLGQDISLALSAKTVRIQAPVPGTNYIGVEIPNKKLGTVSLRSVMESVQFFDVKSPLALALGREVDGTPFATDLVKMPHMLVGGTTGSGKSVCLRAIATCLVMNNSPEDLKLIMIDPKMVELVRFNGLPHLMGKVEVQLDRAIGVLRWVTREMDRRYKLMEEAQARNIVVYNRMKRRKDRLPYMVVLIDELAELMGEYPDQTEHLLTRLAQMARATGIHLIVSTQRPSTDVLTGLIKANFPARIGFAVASGVDSRVIIDSVGSEDLIGRGDLLFQASDAAGPIRLQGCFISDVEMEGVVRFWEEQAYEGEKKTTPPPWERALTRAAILSQTDEMLEEAIRLVQQEGVASTSLLQRKLGVGYPRAGRIMDALFKLGIVGEEQGGGRTRNVLISKEADPISYIAENYKDF